MTYFFFLLLFLKRSMLLNVFGELYGMYMERLKS